MAKILVYEDNASDLVGRYSKLNPRHDVHVRFGGGSQDPINMIERVYNVFGIPEEQRFDPNNIQPFSLRRGDYDPTKESADVYFLDGLRGDCFTIIQKLPKERAFIYTDHLPTELRAKEQGYNVVGDKSVEEIVERLSSC